MLTLVTTVDSSKKELPYDGDEARLFASSTLCDSFFYLFLNVNRFTSFIK